MRSKVEFKKLDGDDSSNDAIKKRYGIRGYPSIIFTDNTQKALLDTGAPKSAEEFKSLIAQFVK